MIDINKPVQTKSGKRVINLQYVPLNSAGNEVTFPIKGTIVLREKPYKTTFNVWTKNGINEPVWNSNSDFDIINI
jgi:hypothetical protein